MRKIDGEKNFAALKSAAATLAFILQLEGDKQVLQTSLITAMGSSGGE